MPHLPQRHEATLVAAVQHSPKTKRVSVAFALAFAALGVVNPQQLSAQVLAAEVAQPEPEPTRLLWGDTHLHTPYSFDAYLNGNYEADPDTSYRWAKGEPVLHPYAKTRIKIETPLDFLVVSDHAEFVGLMRGLVNGEAELSDMGPIGNVKRWFIKKHIKSALESHEGPAIFKEIMPKGRLDDTGKLIDDDKKSFSTVDRFGDPKPTVKNSWHALMDAADRHYEPGKFTTLVGWEWTSTPSGVNLHRVVMSSSSGEQAKQYIPYGADQSEYPEDLWAWLDDTEQKTGLEFLSIPHNSNISKGYMFAETTVKGKAISADYAKRRIKYEPVVEITQIKGDSEAHPKFSPNDEFADFETYHYFLQSTKPDMSRVKAHDYARGALAQGLKIEQSVGTNPYKFGMIGSTDAHTSVSSAEENNFWGKMAIDSIPVNKIGGGKGGIPSASGWDMSASGLAAVWAKDNTREEIFAAFKRKEVYATTGPRIALRVFGAWNFEGLDARGDNIAQVGYAQGTPMGGDLSVSPSAEAAPEFIVQAVRDPVGANLDRVQMVKGWLDPQGEAHERVYNLAWSGERSLDSDGRIAPVGDTVDRKTGEVDNRIGAPELVATWQDPDFKPEQRAFYYVRVLQIPTARHSYLDALALGVEHPEHLSEVIQERAYSSPIWYSPR